MMSLVIQAFFVGLHVLFCEDSLMKRTLREDYTLWKDKYKSV